MMCRQIQFGRPDRRQPWLLHVPGMASVFALLFALASPAASQPPAAPGGNTFGRPGVTRPTTSPYLNLLRNNGRGNFALDYHRLVRPEQQWRNYTSRLNQRLNTVERTLSTELLPDGSVPQVRTTGHPTSFLNTGSYFPQSPR
jgi:hypothetical protein